MDDCLLTFLRLTVTPFSNQHGERLRKTPIRDILSRSQLYMIVQRQEVFFDDVERPPIDGVLTLTLRSGTETIKDVTFDVSQFLDDDAEDRRVAISVYPHGLEIRDSGGKILFGATTMAFLFHYWRQEIEVGGLEDFRKFTEFELLYVGISKKEDSFTRLFERGHKKRLEILSNESQIRREARLTDELYLLLFHTEDLGIRMPMTEADFEQMNAPTPDKIKQVADAEKAFVRMMGTKYNEVTYPNFPKGTDGLYEEGLTRYAFSIDEDITLNVGENRLRCVSMQNINPHYQGDFIFVQGDQVELVKPEVPYLPRS